MKKILTLVTLFLVVMLGALTVPVMAVPDAPSATKKIAVVFSTGGLGDKSFNDAAYEGMIRANDTLDVDIDYVEPANVDEINSNLETYAATEEYDLIIAIGFSSGDGVNASALAHPNQQFLIIDSVIALPNISSITFAEHEGSFLVGAMAAMVTKTNKIAFLGGLDIPLINKFRTGYEQGAKYINSDIEFLAQYSPDSSNPWGDLEGGKSVALSFIDDGADIVYAAAGGTGLGIFTAVEEKVAAGEEVYAIGVDSNQDYLKPGMILTSMIKRVDVAVETQIKAICDGTWDNGSSILGLKENGVGISSMDNTTTEKNVIFKNGMTRYEIVMDIDKAIKNGTLVVDDELLTWPTKDAGIPGFEGFLALLTLGSIGIIPIIRKKRK